MTRMVFPRFLLKSYVPLEHERFVRFCQDPVYDDDESVDLPERERRA